MGDIVGRTSRAPEHGSVEFKNGLVHTHFSDFNPCHVCNARTVLATQIWYTISFGLTGGEGFSVERIYPTGQTFRLNYPIYVG